MSDFDADNQQRWAVNSGPLFPGRLSWAVLVAVMAIDATWLAWSEHFSLKLSSLFGLLPSVVLLAVLATYSRSHADPLFRRLHEPLMGVLFVVSGFSAIRVFNHLTMSIPFPLADSKLAYADGLLGFDWVAYATWVAHHPVVKCAFSLAYQGLTLVIVLVSVLLFVAIGSGRAREFCRLVFWTSLVTTIVGAACPARAAMDWLAPPEVQQMFAPGTGTYHLSHLRALRSAAEVILDLYDLPGLVVIPSFHTVCGLLIIYACRGHRFIWPVAILYSVVMIASTPVMGGHYFIDLIAGTLLTVVAITADRLLRGELTFGDLLPLRLQRQLIAFVVADPRAERGFL